MCESKQHFVYNIKKWLKCYQQFKVDSSLFDFYFTMFFMKRFDFYIKRKTKIDK